MALYAIGDVQGCLRSLERLLRLIEFQPERDRLWLVGDLVNRGPRSAGVLRRARELNAEVVLGNHDLHLLAIAAGARPVKENDTFDDVLDADDREELIDWLASRPVLIRDDALGYVMVHAGLPPVWNVAAATSIAREVEDLVGRRARDADFLASMYGDEPDEWDADLSGMGRLRYAINAFTRLRFCDVKGRLALRYSGPPGTQPDGFDPWFRIWPRESHRVVFGHWSRLGAGDHGVAISTDSGCVWGGELTAVRLDPEPLTFFSVECSERY